jgi:hypothetical protein
VHPSGHPRFDELYQLLLFLQPFQSQNYLSINVKYQLPTIRRLPKACRHLAGDKLSSIINNCLSTKSISFFENFLLFSYRAFNVAAKSDKSLNKHIKENLPNFEVTQIRTASKKRTYLSLAKK